MRGLGREEEAGGGSNEEELKSVWEAMKTIMIRMTNVQMLRNAFCRILFTYLM